METYSYGGRRPEIKGKAKRVMAQHNAMLLAVRKRTCRKNDRN